MEQLQENVREQGGSATLQLGPRKDRTSQKPRKALKMPARREPSSTGLPRPPIGQTWTGGQRARGVATESTQARLPGHCAEWVEVETGSGWAAYLISCSFCLSLICLSSVCLSYLCVRAKVVECVKWDWMAGEIRNHKQVTFALLSLLYAEHIDRDIGSLCLWWVLFHFGSGKRVLAEDSNIRCNRNVLIFRGQKQFYSIFY